MGGYGCERVENIGDKSMKGIIIFGTGDYGKLAFYFYSSRCNIICFVDNDRKKQGSKWNNIEICSPDILKHMVNPTVIIAVSEAYHKEIEKQLYENYGIRQVATFSVSHDCLLLDEKCFEDNVIIRYKGGLGNQMFQYAFAKYLEKKGKNVTADISFLGNILYTCTLYLEEIFQNIKLTSCINRTIKNKWIKENIDICTAELEQDWRIKDLKDVVLDGFWQSCKFADSVREDLLIDFEFKNEKEEKLLSLVEKMKESICTSVHFRRGDYLNEKESKVFGGICTKDYYQNAIEYIRNRYSDSRFFIFSNDIQWVKENYIIDNAVYIDSTLFDHYQDWYDLYLMSQCKNNIIANSTFSWWGAWLNQSIDKMVIAPKKWMNTQELYEIYPKSWIKI